MRRWALLAVLLVMTISTVGCSGGSSSVPATPATTPEPTPEPELLPDHQAQQFNAAYFDISRMGSQQNATEWGQIPS